MELTLDQALQKGIEAHKAGKVQEADQLYTAILKADPKHPDANHNMGILAVGVNKVEAALPFLKTALESNPKIDQFWLSYIDALIKLNRIDEAKKVLAQAKSKGIESNGLNKIEERFGRSDTKKAKNQEPPEDQLKALVNLYTQGQYQEVQTQASKSLLKHPNSVNLYNIIGAAYKGLGKLEEAINAYQKALSIKPNYADAYSNMGNSLNEQGKLEEALDAYNKAISINPDYAEAYNNMGNALKGLGKLEKAVDAYKKAISIKPDYAEAYNNMGVTLKDQGKLDKAIGAYKEAVSIKPDFTEAYTNMGNVLTDKKELEQATAAINTALELEPQYAEAYNSMGNLFQKQGNFEGALESYNKAISLKLGYADVYDNSTELLKTYSPKNKQSGILFESDSSIKKLSSKLIGARSNEDIIKNIIEGLSYVGRDAYKYKTALSQIYKRNDKDLNCKRHKKIFEIMDIIPEFCFACFKVQVEVPTFVDLIKVTSLFYEFDFEDDLTRKTMIELRPNIPGYYKGLIYCNSLHQAKEVKSLLDISLKTVFDRTAMSCIKRGCSEYPLKFPNYGEISTKLEKIMKYPDEWRPLEERFDKNELIEPNENNQPSLVGFCLSDFYIIQKWIDYAKAIEDPSVKVFNERPIIFKDIYKISKERSAL